MIVLSADLTPSPYRPVSRSGFATCRTEMGGLAAADRCARRGQRSAFGCQHLVKRPKSPSLGVTTRSGRWVVLHRVLLAAADNQRIAVIVEPAHPSRIAPLLMSAYGLLSESTDQTRVGRTFSTTDIADRLVISVHTVQSHLTRILTNTGQWRSA